MMRVLLLAATIAGASSQIEMHASGTTNPSKLHWSYMSTLEDMSGQPTLMTYRGVGSSTGILEFVAGVNDFGAADIPLGESNDAELEAKGVTAIQIPHVIGAISIFHSVPASTMSSALEFSADLLARIFSSEIKTWDHPDILAANPSLQVPANQKITVCHRVKGSSSTALVTQYLANAATPGVWSLGSGKSINWPEDTLGIQGSGPLSQYLVDNEYSIGYVDSGHGVELGLQEVALKNADGNWLTSQEADIGMAAQYVELPKATESWAHVNLVNKPGPKTWPITAFSYMFIRQDLTAAGTTGALVKAYAMYALSEAGQDHVGDFGFIKVPQNVIDTGMEGINSIVLAPGVEEFAFELSTDAIAGAGANVLSVKRRSYNAYIIASMRGTIAGQAERIADLEGRLLAVDHSARIDALQADLASVRAVQQGQSNALALAALVVGGLALVGVVCAFTRIQRNQYGAPAKANTPV